MYTHTEHYTTTTPGQTHKYRQHMYIHTKHFAKQVRKSLMHQEDIERSLDMFFKGKKMKKQNKRIKNDKLICI